MADREPILPYEPKMGTPMPQAQYFFIAAAAIAAIGLLICLKVLVSLCLVPRGSTIRPFDDLVLIMLGGGTSAIFGSVIAIAGLLAGDRRPQTRRHGLLTLLLTLGTGIVGSVAWRVIISVRDLQLPG